MLTKTDFKLYLECPKSFWLLKNQPAVFKKEMPALSGFNLKLMRDGYEVERLVKKFWFPGAIDLRGKGDCLEIVLREPEAKFFFEATFKNAMGLEIRADVLEKNSDGTFNLYEIKSNSKNNLKRTYVEDIAFQKIALEGVLEIKNYYLICLNNEYKKSGEVDFQKLFFKINMSFEIEKIEGEVRLEIEKALRVLEQKEYKGFCPCYFKSRANHCKLFSFFNFNLEPNSVYYLSRLGSNKIEFLLNNNCLYFDQISSDINIDNKFLSFNNLKQIESFKRGEPIILKDDLKNFLGEFNEPLYFFDYECYSSIVPQIDGFGATNQLPFQFSLHVLEADNTLKHFEYLADGFESPEKLIAFLSQKIGDKGNLISWHASYEKAINEKLANVYPKWAGFLYDLNERTIDLKEVFVKFYFDYKFLGSASIKSVLPIIVPELSYKDLKVQDGTQAMESFYQMVNETDLKKRRQMRDDLLDYCKLDTLAMVKIYQKVKKIN